LNSRPPVPQTGALTELRYAPTLGTKHLGETAASTNSELPPERLQANHKEIGIDLAFFNWLSDVHLARSVADAL
jgi:hypothetical protein